MSAVGHRWPRAHTPAFPLPSPTGRREESEDGGSQESRKIHLLIGPPFLTGKAVDKATHRVGVILRAARAWRQFDGVAEATTSDPGLDLC